MARIFEGGPAGVLLMAIPTFNGEAIPVLTIQPDWTQPIILRPRHKTIIAEAIDLTEERQNLAPRALYGLEFQSLTLSTQESGYLKRILDLAKALPVAVPIWPMAAKLTVAASSSATTLTVEDTSWSMFDVFHQHAILWESFLLWEIVELNAVGSTSVTLLAGLAHSYTTKAKLIPVAYGSLSRESLAGLTDANCEWRCIFEEVFHRLNDQSIPEDAPDDLFYRFDDMESYTELVALNGLDGGSGTRLVYGFTGPYVDRANHFGLKALDDMESYTVSAAVNGLNGGSGFNGPYVDR